MTPVTSILTAQWLDSNFIPMDSKKFEFWNFDYTIRFVIENKPGYEKLRSRDCQILEKSRFYFLESIGIKFESNQYKIEF